MLGFALLAKGDTKQAMGFFRRAHVMSPDTVRYKIGFARALRDLSLKRPDPELIGTVLRLLGTPGVEPRDLASVVERGIRLDPTRPEERRVGKEWVRTCRSRGSPFH